MQNVLKITLLLLVSSLCGCQTVTSGKAVSLKNPGFEETSNVTPVPGWELEEHAGDWKSKAYEMVIDHDAGSGSSGALRVTRLRDEVYGWVHQKVPVLPDAVGKKMTFSASLKAANVGAEGWLLIVNMEDYRTILQQFRSTPITGNTDWRRAEVTAVIPDGTAAIDVGFILLDAGTGWGDDASMSID